MSDLNKDKLKEQLLNEVNKTTPDLWSKIDGRLEPHKFIAPTQTNFNKKSPSKKSYIEVFAGLAALVAVVLGITFLGKNLGKNHDLALDDNHNKINSQDNTDTTNVEPFDNSPIEYSNLKFAEGISPSEKAGLNGGSATASLDIIPFSEDLLSDMSWMGKVTILNSYYKDYKYDTYSDKFEPNGRLHMSMKTIVYELRIDDIYYSEDDLKVGDTFKVEQNCFNGCYLTDSPMFELKINRQYILPLYYTGESILHPESMDMQNYAEGDITRDGQYSIVYPFAPQIEVTLDNEYLFHNQWESLINDKTLDVIMPNYEENVDESFYTDKMKLRSDEGFIDDLKSLVNKTKNISAEKFDLFKVEEYGMARGWFDKSNLCLLTDKVPTDNSDEYLNSGVHKWQELQKYNVVNNTSSVISSDRIFKDAIVSPYKDKIAFIETLSHGTMQVVVKNLDDGSENIITQIDKSTDITWSSNNKYLSVVKMDSIVLCDTENLTTSEIPIDGIGIRYEDTKCVPSDDGTKLLINNRGFYLVNLKDNNIEGEPVKVEDEGVETFTFYYNPKTGDNNSILLTAPAGEVKGLYLYDINTNEKTLIESDIDSFSISSYSINIAMYSHSVLYVGTLDNLSITNKFQVFQGIVNGDMWWNEYGDKLLFYGETEDGGGNYIVDTR